MLTVRSPFDRGVVAELDTHDDAAVDAALTRARTAQRTWAHTPLADRAQYVTRALDELRAAREDLAREVTRQMGKPIGEARREVDTLLDRGLTTLGLAADALAPEPLPALDGFERRVEHAPLGVVFQIAAWNYPLLIPINIIVPALLAGDAVVLKHSPLTPLTGRSLARAFADGGAPDGLVQDLVIDHDQAARVIRDSRVAHVAFTGSVRGGREVNRIAAERTAGFIDIGLELGGNDAAYVAVDADLEFAVAGVVDGACYNAGQSCCAVERVYVHAARYDEFLDRAREIVAGYALGDPLDEATTLGPLARAAQLPVLDHHLRDATARGARLLAGGVRPPDMRGNFITPALLADVPRDAVVMREESFGPLVPVQRVSGDDEALARMDETRYGLTASVWTADRDRAERFARGLDVGTVFQNRCDYLDPMLPWTGARDSGRGSTLARAGLLHLTRRKSIHFRLHT